MAKKLSKKEEYMLNVQDLMDAVPGSKNVAKQVDVIKDGGKTHRLIKWIVDGYSVYSGSRDVYSIGPGDTTSFEFVLKVKDYKKFTDACEEKRAQIFEQIKVKKK